MTRRPLLVLTVACLASVVALGAARAADASWSVSAANRCTIRTLLLGPAGRAASLPDEISRLAALAEGWAGEASLIGARAETVDLLGIQAASRDRAAASFSMSESGTPAPGVRRALTALLAEAAIDLAGVAPRGSLPDETLGRIVVALARTGRLDAALAALDRIPNPDTGRRATQRIAQLLHVAGAAADAQRFYDRIPDAARDPFTEGLVPNLLALGRTEDALAIALAGDIRMPGQYEIPIAEHHLLAGDPAAARRVYGLLRDGLQQPGAHPAMGALESLVVGLAILGDSAEAERLRAGTTTPEDRQRLATGELVAAIRIGVAAHARGRADLARVALAQAQRAAAGGATLEDGSEELVGLVELTGLLDGAAAADQLVASLAPGLRSRLVVLWARDGDVARALAAMPDTRDLDGASIVLAAARARLAADDLDGTAALLGRLDDYDRAPAVGSLLLDLARGGRAERVPALLARLPEPPQLAGRHDSTERIAAYRDAILSTLGAGARAPADVLLAGVEPELRSPLAAELLQSRALLPADLRLSLIDRLIDAAKTDPLLSDAMPGLLIDRARLLAARGDRADAALELQFAGDLIGLMDEPVVRLEKLFALVAASVDLGSPGLGASLTAARSLVEGAPPGPFERGYMPGSDKLGDATIVMRRRLRLAELLVLAGDVAGARALIAPVRTFYDSGASEEERAYLGDTLARALIVAGPAEDALSLRFEGQFGNQLAPVLQLVSDGLARANPALIEAALDHLAARLGQMQPDTAAQAGLDILRRLYGGATEDPAFDRLCDLPRDRGIADLATAGATAAANAALTDCLARPGPSCVAALVLPAATAEDRESRVWVFAESLVRLLDRDRRPVVQAAIGLLGAGLDGEGRVLPVAAPVAPRFDPFAGSSALAAPVDDLPDERAFDEARFQLVRLWSLLGDASRALALVPRIVDPGVRLQAILRLVGPLHRAGDGETAADLLWLAREMAGSAPSRLWARLAVGYAETGDLAGASRLAQQSARQGMGQFDPRQLVEPMIDIAVARLRAGDGVSVLARLEAIPEGPSRDLAFARLAIRAAGIGQDAVTAAAAARVGNANWRRQSLVASAEVQLGDGRVGAAARSAAEAGDPALGERIAAQQRAIEAAGGNRAAQAALAGVAAPELRFEAQARLALTLAQAAAPRRAEMVAAARTALEAVAVLPATAGHARLLAQLAESLARHDREAALAAFGAALRTAIALEAPNPAALWNARIDPASGLLAAAAALAP